MKTNLNDEPSCNAAGEQPGEEGKLLDDWIEDEDEIQGEEE